MEVEGSIALRSGRNLEGLGFRGVNVALNPCKFTRFTDFTCFSGALNPQQI